MTADCLVLGVGSPFGEDVCGFYVIDLLKKQGADCELIKCDRPSLSLIDYFHLSQPTIIIDALNSAQKPGLVKRLTVEDLASQPLLSSHGFGLAHALKLAEKLGYLPEPLWIYGIVIDLHAKCLSDGVIKGCELVAQEICAYLNR